MPAPAGQFQIHAIAKFDNSVESVERYMPEMIFLRKQALTMSRRELYLVQEVRFALKKRIAEIVGEKVAAKIKEYFAVEPAISSESHS